MKMAGLVFVSILFFPFFDHKAYAETSIDVSNNGSDSQSSVSVTNNISTSTNSTGTTRTKIRIESNGKVQEYESDKPEDISIESEDGNSKVTVKNGGSKSTITTPEKNFESTKSAVKKEITGEMSEKIEARKNFFRTFFETLRKLFFPR